jgi:hypothetical protein
MKTEEQQLYNSLKNKGREFIKRVNNYYRQRDESHLYPVRGKFNVTERAIRRIRKLKRDGECLDGLEYIYALSAEISKIVNSWEVL